MQSVKCGQAVPASLTLVRSLAHSQFDKRSLTLLIAHTARRATIVLVDLFDLFFLALGVATTMASSRGCYFECDKVMDYTTEPDQRGTKRQRSNMCVSPQVSLNPAQSNSLPLDQSYRVCLELQVRNAIGVRVKQRRVGGRSI